MTITNCPTCSKPAIGTVDLIPGTARFTDFNESGEVDYEGWTDVRWDSQQTQEGPNELPLVTCGVHEWETKIEGN